jgi:hypothetical protein
VVAVARPWVDLGEVRAIEQEFDRRQNEVTAPSRA